MEQQRFRRRHPVPACTGTFARLNHCLALIVQHRLPLGTRCHSARSQEPHSLCHATPARALAWTRHPRRRRQTPCGGILAASFGQPMFLGSPSQPLLCPDLPAEPAQRGLDGREHGAKLNQVGRADCHHARHASPSGRLQPHSEDQRWCLHSVADGPLGDWADSDPHIGEDQIDPKLQAPLGSTHCSYRPTGPPRRCSRGNRA